MSRPCAQAALDDRRGDGDVLDLALVPSCNTFESHFTRLGVRPEQLANGEYRGTWITQYAELLAEHGVRVTLVVPSRSPGEVDGSVLRVRMVPVDRGFARVPEAVWRWRLRPIGSAWSSRGLERHLGGFDVIYVQEYAYGRAGYLGSRLSGRRLIAAHHGAPVAEAPGWVRRSLPSYTALTALTTDEADRLRQALGEAADRVLHLPNWVQEGFFAAASSAPRPRHVVWAGRFDARIKGLNDLLDAVATLPDVTLDLVGTGPDLPALRRRVAADPGLVGRVTMPGRLDGLDAIVSRVGAADVFVNSSTVEGLPIAVLEALATGRRTVLTELDYVTSELRSVPGVRVAAPGDPASIAAAIRAHLAAPQSAAERAAISAWTRDRFSRGSAGRAVVDCVREVAGVAA